MTTGKRLGRCMVCGQRVKTDDNYIVSEQGYCHNSCLQSADILA